MDSFEWNKILMAAGFTILGIFGVNEAANTLYEVEAPAKAGYIVEGVDVASVEHGSTTTGTGSTTTAQAETPPDFGTVLTSADMAAGENIAKQCAQCHTWDKGGANKIGPNLWGVVGGPKAHRDDFNYSSAMKNKGGTWEYAELFEYLRKPAAFVPGTKMSFAGLRKPEDRINIIAFLRAHADAPYALPAPQAALTPPAPGTETPAPAGEAPAAGVPAEGTPPTQPGQTPTTETAPAQPQTPTPH